jgi:hypothetical protein
MIYSCTFQAMNTRHFLPSYYNNYVSHVKQYPEYHKYVDAWEAVKGTPFNSFQLHADVIKESENDVFCYIITKPQAEDFKDWVKKYELEDYIIYEGAYVTNGNHPSAGRNLSLVLFASKKHFWRDMYELDEETV